MRIINKKIGETPLEALNNFRAKNKCLKLEKMSYIGRLDPMAEGKMIVIVGGEENKEREKYLNFDKEYTAEFLIGISTDSLDILGLITNAKILIEVQPHSLKKAVLNLKKLKNQKYPWFSGKTINGEKMFEIYKRGEIKGVKRPINKIKIEKISEFKTDFIKKEKLKGEILKRIKKAKGDFRQKEISSKWKEFFKKTEINKFQTFSFKTKVSSGTFIRSFAENFAKYLKTPVLLYKLKRTKIFVK